MTEVLQRCATGVLVLCGAEEESRLGITVDYAPRERVD